MELLVHLDLPSLATFDLTQTSSLSLVNLSYPRLARRHFSRYLLERDNHSRAPAPHEAHASGAWDDGNPFQRKDRRLGCGGGGHSSL